MAFPQQNRWRQQSGIALLLSLSFGFVAVGCDRSETSAAVEERAAPAAAPDASQPSSGQPSSGQPSSGQPSSGQPSSGQPSSEHPTSIDDSKWKRPAPPVIDEAATRPDSDNLLSAKPRYERIVPRVTLRSWQRFENVIYEANNLVMRGPRDQETGLYERDGAEIASTWRRYANGTRGLFVLRDSLFSQQDHPVANDPYAPLLPPNWITAVAHEASDSETFDLPELPAVDDDAGWRQFETEAQLFGDLPTSESVFEAAVGGGAGAANARSTLHILYLDVRAMIAAIERGPRAVAQVGAERIAASDRAYFGVDTRRERIIPIFVENPTPHEIDEGKGIDLPDRDVSDEVLQTVFRVVYARRLEDGDLALERYDLSKAAERKRAVSALEALIPESANDDRTTKVWLWVTGELDPDKKLQGEDARPYIGELREAIDHADIDTSRLELFSKPSVALAEDDFESALKRELARFEALDMPMSVELPTTHSALRDTICCASEDHRNQANRRRE
jgi:hypothetical protein